MELSHTFFLVLLSEGSAEVRDSRDLSAVHWEVLGSRSA